MDNRKLRYAKRKAKEKILSQRDRAYYRNLHFRENPNEQAEESLEHYAAQNMAGYGRKYANMVKAQGRKLFIRQKEREWQSKKLREQGGRAETLFSSESTLHQPAEKRAGMQVNSGTVNANLNRRLRDKNKTKQFMTFPASFRWECVYMVEGGIEGKHSRNSSAESLFCLHFSRAIC